MVTHNISPRMSLNESRFNSSILLSNRSDKLPRKPNRESLEDDDGDDADFTDIITVNPYESMCTTLAETMSIIDKLFDASASTIFDDSLNDLSYGKSTSDSNGSEEPILQESDFKNSTSTTSTRYYVSHSVPKEDEPPKRPTRGLSPPRFVCTSYDGCESYELEQ
jgi:hypothetical protein